MVFLQETFLWIFLLYMGTSKSNLHKRFYRPIAMYMGNSDAYSSLQIMLEDSK